MLNITSILGGMLLMLTMSNIAIATDSTEPYIMGGSTMGARNIAPHDIDISLNAAMKEVLPPNSKPIKILTYAGTQALYNAFDKGEIDGIFGTTLEFLGREEYLGKAKMALVYKNKTHKQKLLLVTRKNSGVLQLSDLKDKRITLSKTQDLEKLYLNTLLLRKKLPEVSEFFSRQIEAKSSNLAIMSVFFNNSDATIVYENQFKTATELNPQIGEKLLVLETSPAYLGMLGGARKNLSEVQQDEFTALFKKMSQTKKAKQILAMVDAEYIDIVNDEELQSVRELMKEYQTLKKLYASSH